MNTTQGFPRAPALGNTSQASPRNSTSQAEYFYHHIIRHDLPAPILFISLTCFTGVVIRTLLKKSNVPHSALFVILGLILGSLTLKFDQVKVITGVMGEMSPVLLMHTFLPALIYSAAFQMNPRVFWKSFGQVVVLAFPCFVINSCLTGLLAVEIFRYNWNWYTGMMFGILTSSTDPILSAFSIKDIAASHISVLLEAEGLFIDSTCYIIFDVFTDLQTNSLVSVVSIEICIKLILKFVGSPIFGFLISRIVMFWLSRTVNDEMAEVAISLAVVYIAFYLAEWIGLSGVIAVASLGIFLDIVSFSPGTEMFLHRFWDLLAFFANTLIFTIVGVVISEKAFKYVDTMDLFYIVILYIGLFIIRLLVVSLLSVLLKRIGYGFDWRTGIIVVWSGMRGVFTLTMALVAFQTSELGSIEMKSKILFLIAGTTLLNLFINATSVKKIVTLLGFYDISSAKRMAMYSIVQRLRQSAAVTLSMLKMDRFLADANWNMVETASLIEDPYNTSESNVTLEELFPELITSECPDCQKDVAPEPTSRDIADMIDEARLRMLKAQMYSYWKQYNSGMLNRETTRLLINATESYIDQKGKFMGIQKLKQCWEGKGFFVFLRRKLENWVYNIKEEAIKPSKIKALKFCYKIVHTKEFEFTIYVVILLNVFPVGLYSVQDITDIYDEEIHLLNYFFISLYMLEVLVKVLAMRKYYIFNHWNQFDVCVLLIGILELFIEGLLKNLPLRTIEIMSSTVLLFRLLRLIRGLRLVKVLMPRLIEVLSNQINKQLSCAYDIAKGFVIGEEDVKSVVDQISDNNKITQKLKTILEKDRQDTMQELGLLQRDHPEIVIAAKTSQAIRAVLNNIKETLHDLLAGGIIDRIDGAKLHQIIHLKMQQLATFPITIPTATAEELLRNIPWLENSKAQTTFIKSKAKILFFDYGDTICREGEAPQGIHLIVYGLVKLYGSNPLFGHKTAISQEKYDSTLKIPFTDFRGSGTVLGEVNCLTKQAMEVTIECETVVQTCFITINDLFAAFNAFLEVPSLEYKIWLAVAVRISLSTLKENVSFQSWTSNKLYLWLSNAYVENIEINRKFDVYDGSMEGVILVYGSLKDCQLLVPYYAPCVVPRTSHQVQGTASITKLLIVPSVSNSKITTSTSERPIGCTSAPCLQHAAARRRARSNRPSIGIAVSDSLTMLRTNESYIGGQTDAAENLPGSA